MYKSIELVPLQAYAILMNDWNEEISGFFIAEGSEWILLHDNQNDFMIDGLRFVHKRNIDEILREEDEIFKEKIRALKYPDLSIEHAYDLDDTGILIRQIQAKNELFHFDTYDEEELTLGKITSVADKDFETKTLTPTATWGDVCFCEFAELSSLAIENDYLNSLSFLIK
ncbi:hypothetical protein [Flavicella sediminum]|uniref:hypothetical protein n=1 Tax=Flavicella sediminum TaxID=2585141 RepID=UPI00111FDCEB|nr:hypothetical protein [Flavicella sediminum]